MILFFERRITSWTSRFNVYKEDGNVFCQICGKLSAAGKFLVLDEDGNQIGEVSETLLSVPSRFRLIKDGKVQATVKKGGFLRSGYTADNGWTVEDKTKDWNWTIRKEDGSEAARLSRVLPDASGLNAVVIADDADPLLAVMMIVAVDAQRCEKLSAKIRRD